VEVVSFEPRTARSEPDVPTTRLPSPPAPDVYPLHQLARFRQVRRLLRDRRPDVVHAYFFWPILYARLLRASGTIRRLVENREDEGFNWGAHEYAWLRVTRGLPDAVVCVSEAVRRVALEREKLDPDRTTVVHNGIEEPGEVPEEAAADLRRELGFPEDAPVVGMVSNLNRAVKGVDRFLEAVPDILAQVPSARFVVVGGGEDEERLRREIRDAGLDGKVALPGYREDVETFYALMDVSVLTSFSEGLSITLLESMGHGVPVVATRVGGNPEVVVDGETGYLVPPDGMDEFGDRVVQLLGDPHLRARMGAGARQRVRTEFSLEGAAAAYDGLYGRLLEILP
jgi:glycosyltransferase involved in cell wall biosynthesis